MLQPKVAKFGLFALVVRSIGVVIGRFLLEIEVTVRGLPMLHPSILEWRILGAS